MTRIKLHSRSVAPAAINVIGTECVVAKTPATAAKTPFTKANTPARPQHGSECDGEGLLILLSSTAGGVLLGLDATALAYLVSEGVVV
jgi:hypothetical protein